MKDKLKKILSSSGRYYSSQESSHHEIVLKYLQNYYRTTDEYYLKEALQIAKDKNIDMILMLSISRSKLN